MNIAYRTFNSKRRFGIEFEVNRHLTQKQLRDLVIQALPRAACQIQGWHYDCGNESWIVKTDASCGDQGNKDLDGGGYEVVSCVGKSVKHLDNIEQVALALNKGGAVVNKFCGLHCHVEIADFDDSLASTLLAYWCKIEHIMAQLVPIHRTKSHHCKFFTKHRTKFPQASRAKNHNDFWRAMKLKKLNAPAKRTAMTLVNYQRTKSQSGEFMGFHRPTVELRLPEGTIDAFQVKNWVRFFIHFVESCSQKPFPSNLEPATLDEALEILGLKQKNSFLILSPGLFETKVWLLSRLYTHSRNYRIKQAAVSAWQAMSLPTMPWRFDFPQVMPPTLPITAKSGTKKLQSDIPQLFEEFADLIPTVGQRVSHIALPEIDADYWDDDD